jgi:zinc protease
VWSVPHSSIPVATVMLLVRRGAADDPSGREGLAAITTDMLDEGTGAMSSIEIHEALARVGAQLDSDIGPDATLLTVTVLSRFLKPALSVLADIVVRPSMRDDDFERVPSAAPAPAGAAAGYAGCRCGSRVHAPDLRAAPLRAHTARQRTVALRADHRRCAPIPRGKHQAWRRDAGDCRRLQHEDVAAVAAEVFSGWNGSSMSPLPVAPPLPGPPRLNIIPRPGAPQSELRIGHVAVARNTPDYHALVAANMVLGGQFVSRINLNLREEKGLTYGARTSFDFRRLPGPFLLQVSVQTAATAEAIHESMAEIAGIRDSRPCRPTNWRWASRP